MKIRQRGHQAARLNRKNYCGEPSARCLRLSGIVGDHENRVLRITSKGGMFSQEYWRAHAAYTQARKLLETARLEDAV